MKRQILHAIRILSCLAAQVRHSQEEAGRPFSFHPITSNHLHLSRLVPSRSPGTALTRVTKNQDPHPPPLYLLVVHVTVHSDPSSKMRQFRYFCSLAFVVESDPSSDTCLTCWCPVLKLLAMSLAAALSLLIICSRKNSPAL